MTPYLISGPSVALICLEAETEERMCNCSHIPWLSSAPVKFVLGAPEHAVGFVTPLHARACCCGSDSYLPRMFPQQSWQLKTTEWISWLLRIVTVLSKSSRSHSHISRNDNKLSPKYSHMVSLHWGQKGLFPTSNHKHVAEPDQSKLSSLAHSFLVVFPILILGKPQ